MGRPLYVLCAGLIGAALLHIVIVLAIPSYAQSDAWTRVSALGAREFFHVLRPGENDLTSANPFSRAAVCRFDISTEPVRVTAFGSMPHWSLAIFDPAANEVYSMNDRIAAEGDLDIVIVTPVQMIGYRKTLPESIAESVLIEFPETSGYLVLNTVAPDASWEAIVDDFLGNAVCQPVSSF